MKRSTRRKPAYTLHVVSDLTGGLAGHLIAAILTQFPDIRFKKVYHTFQDSPQKVNRTVRSFDRSRNIVFHALVDPDSKTAISSACARLKIPHYDLTGSLVQFLFDHTGVAPVNERSRLHQVDEGYFQRIEAMEFTAQHDDGRHLGTLKQADIVIVGISRVSKSPTATYLGSMGYKVANVSIAPEVGFPRELNGVRKRIVALTLQPRALQVIRAQRLEEFNARHLKYANLQDVIREVMAAEAKYRRRGYPMIDTTGLTIERTATAILETLKIKRRSVS